jgi:transposase InsO family protein
LSTVGVRALCIEQGKIGYCESINERQGNKLLNGPQSFFSNREAGVTIEQWRKEYNTIQLHSSLGYRTLTPTAINPKPPFLEQVAAMQ